MHWVPQLTHNSNRITASLTLCLKASIVASDALRRISFTRDSLRIPRENPNAVADSSNLPYLWVARTENTIWHAVYAVWHTCEFSGSGWFGLLSLLDGKPPAESSG